MKKEPVTEIMREGFGFAPSCRVEMFPGEHLVSISMRHGKADILYVSQNASKDDLCDALESSYDAFRIAA